MNAVRVLLVEDNVADVELVKEALRVSSKSYEVEVASDFEEARDYVQSICHGVRKPDILLMDLNLPKGNGLDLLRIFREQPECEGVPVVVVSSSNAARDRRRASELGVSHYFRKPSDLNEFMKLGPLVESIIDGRHTAASTSAG